MSAHNRGTELGKVLAGLRIPSPSRPAPPGLARGLPPPSALPCVPEGFSPGPEAVASGPHPPQVKAQPCRRNSWTRSRRRPLHPSFTLLCGSRGGLDYHLPIISFTLARWLENPTTQKTKPKTTPKQVKPDKNLPSPV